MAAMIKHLLRYGSLAVVTVILAGFGMEPIQAQAQNCSATVTAGQSIQKAIDQASEGATVCLETGSYQENLTIKKSLTLKGKGSAPKDVQIMGAEPERSGIRIESQTAMDVTIENLTVGEAKSAICLVKASEAICTGSVELVGKAKAALRNARVSNDNGFGLYVKDFAQASLSDSVVSESQFGLFLQDSAQVDLSKTTLSGNAYGLFSRGSPKVKLTDSTVFQNEFDGLLVQGSSTMEIQSSTLKENGTGGCEEESVICNGLTVIDQARVTLTDSTIAKNTDWGVSAILKVCGYSEDRFTGQVTFKGKNTIPGNNVSRNQNGKGNPGNHPFKDLPDGQVCLP